ncbi:MAG: phospholipase D-like domain-containing protein [Candidatus Heimdallarchaeota archaeon]
MAIIFVMPTLLMAFTSKTSVVATENPTNTDGPWVVKPDAIPTQTFTGTSTVTCFVGPDSAYDVIMASLDAAATSFYLEVYTLSSEPLVNRLVAAADRGVDVQVSLSDDRVSGYEDDYTEEAAYRLDQAGVIVTWCSSSFTYTHAKFWIVDSQEAFVYTGNWAPSSIPQVNIARTNRELGFMFDDAAIATFYETVFFDDQGIGTPYAGTEPHLGNLQGNETGGTYTHPFDTPPTYTEYLEVTPLFAPDNSYPLLKSLIDNATTTIDVSQQYVNLDCALTYDLIAAADRGVAVRVLMPEPGSSSQNTTELLLGHGIDVRFFKGLGHNHNKHVCADGQVTSISSINWSNNSVVNNRESGAVVKSTNVATYFKTVFDYDWGLSEEPTGYSGDVNILAPLDKEILDGNYLVEAEFLLENYTTGEIKIDGVLKHTWTNPSTEESHSLDTTTIANGIHTMTVVGTTEGAEEISDEIEIQVINVDDWLMLISEVRYDAVTETSGEFIELYNAFGFDVDISFWEISDGESSWFFPDDTVFGSDDILILARDTATYTSEMTALGVEFYAPDFEYTGIILRNDGDEVMFLDAEGGLKDACVWGDVTLSGHTSWAGTMTEDLSLQRDPANKDTDDCSVDFTEYEPAPGYVTIEITTLPWPGFLIIGTIFAISITSIIVRKYSRK